MYDHMFGIAQLGFCIAVSVKSILFQMWQKTQDHQR